MPRVVYLVFGTSTPRGGHKMALRHVETLRTLGFDAVTWMPPDAPLPAWLGHRAPVQHGGAFRADDVLVLPEDALNAMRWLAGSPQRKVIFCQNHFYAASQGISLLSSEEARPYRDVMACSRTSAQWLARFVHHDTIEVVPAFADERLFASADKALLIACAPSKRQLEFRAVQTMIPRLHTSLHPWRWAVIKDKSEVEVAAVMGQATIFLSLSRFEGLGMTTLEAMAAGCLIVGFTGLGGREYARPTNGFWVGEDDVEACAEALARAMVLVEAGQPMVDHMRAAARAAAADYTYAKFLTALEAFWSRRVPRT